MLKCCKERWVCAPQSFSAGTSTWPNPSASVRKSDMVLTCSVTSATLGHHVFGVGDRTRGVQSFRARLRAVHDRMAAIETEWILEALKRLAGGLIAIISEPAIGLEKDGRTKILVL